jgi:hypothetical protein
MLQLHFRPAKTSDRNTTNDDGKLGYEANTASYDPPPLSLQAAIFKTRQLTMQVQRENHQATKPPPATRHRAVMSVNVPLYDMRSHTSSRLQDILQSTRDANKLMMVTTVTTDRLSRIEEDPTYLQLRISFYPAGDTGEDKLDVDVIMPQGWTPKMYLTALNQSIKRHSILSLESISFDGRIYTTINELQWLFSATEESTHSQLTSSASYIRVSGGVMKKV